MRAKEARGFPSHAPETGREGAGALNARLNGNGKRAAEIGSAESGSRCLKEFSTVCTSYGEIHRSCRVLHLLAQIERA
jgi:hypothetical protein